MPNRTTDRICFIGAYPDDRTIRDGMMQRVACIDGIFSDRERTYLDIALGGSRSIEILHPAERVTLVRCNAFLHRAAIRRRMEEAKTVYIHSLNHFVKVMPAGKPPGCRFLWDVHGLVPEELTFLGMPLRGRILRRLERRALRMADAMIHVTEAMRRHYMEKVPDPGRIRHIVYGIHSRTVPSLPADAEAVSRLVSERGWKDKVLFIYSGNAQKWQNADLMLDRFARLRQPRYHLMLLSGEPETFRRKTRARGVENCTVLSLPPAELAPYYEAAHYGFLLRDDHILNRVACPTKMVEYLHHGIVPVVTLAGIGDFGDMGYEFLPLDALSGDLPPRKSEKNREIGWRCLHAADPGRLADFVLSHADGR